MSKKSKLAWLQTVRLLGKWLLVSDAKCVVGKVALVLCFFAFLQRWFLHRARGFGFIQPQDNSEDCPGGRHFSLVEYKRKGKNVLGRISQDGQLSSQNGLLEDERLHKCCIFARQCYFEKCEPFQCAMREHHNTMSARCKHDNATTSKSEETDSMTRIWVSQRGSSVSETHVSVAAWQRVSMTAW